MSDDAVYRALQRHLDGMPVGFPETTSGAESRILKQLFSPGEARIAVQLPFASLLGLLFSNLSPTRI